MGSIGIGAWRSFGTGRWTRDRLHPAVAAVGAGNRVRASWYTVQRLIRQAQERQIAAPPAAHLRHWRVDSTVHRVFAHVQHRVDRRQRVCAPHGDVCARCAARRSTRRSARHPVATNRRRGHRVRPAPPRLLGALARARSMGIVCQLAHRPPDPSSAAHAEATPGMAAAGRPEQRPGAVHGHDAAGYAFSSSTGIPSSFTGIPSSSTASSSSFTGIPSSSTGIPSSSSTHVFTLRIAVGSSPRCTPTPMSEPFGSASADDAASPADCPSRVTAAATRAPSSSSREPRKRTFSST